MAKEKFPWLPEDDQINEVIIKEPEEVKTHLHYLKENYKFIAFISFTLLLFSISFLQKKKTIQKVPKAPTTAVSVVSLFPIAKKSEIKLQLIKPVTILKSQLTKTQRQQIVHPDDLYKLSGKIFAKKDIAPRKPIFWSDLSYVEQNKKKSIQKKIIFRGVKK